MRVLRIKGKENVTAQGNGQGSDDCCSQTLLQCRWYTVHLITIKNKGKVRGTFKWLLEKALA
jgi:hypothetical protein